MTDTPDPKPKRITMFAVDSQDFVRFLVSKGAEKDEDCPVCHSENWNILCPDDDGPTLRIGMPVRNRPEIFYLSVFAYFCANCGYIRSHMASTVHDWVQKNPRIDSDVVDDEQAPTEDVSDE